MITFSFNSDMATDSNGIILLSKNIDALKEKIEQKLSFLKGDYFLNKDYGINYFDNILGKYHNNKILNYIFEQKILEEPEVVSILSIETNLKNNKLNIVIVLETVYGNINISRRGI